MKKAVSIFGIMLLLVSVFLTGCGNNVNNPAQGEVEATTTSFNELASYYDELAKGDIAVEVETTSDGNEFYEFSGDKNLLPEGIYEKLNKIVRDKYKVMYNKYGKNFVCPKIILEIDIGYVADSPCHANGKTVYINPNWFVDNPDDCDALVSAIFQTIQEYEGSYPSWIASSIRAYVRAEFKSEYASKSWGIPSSYNGESYEKGDVYGAAFLKWIGSSMEKDFVYRLHTALLDGTYKESFWETETGHTFGQLWAMYKGE